MSDHVHPRNIDGQCRRCGLLRCRCAEPSPPLFFDPLAPEDRLQPNRKRRREKRR